MNLPNKLTVLRCLMVPLFMRFMYTNWNFNNYLVALIIFAVASFTDMLDGKIARKYNMVTDFGKFMDPLADKMLTTVALIYLCKVNLCHEIVLCIVLIREFAVSGIRMVAAANPKGGKVIAAGFAGKAKTVLQMLSICLALVGLSLYQSGKISHVKIYGPIFNVVNILMWIMAGLTVYSGMQYIMPNIDLIKNAK